ncbi:MAG: hypothetical protein BJBARM5_0314 [Candidatus Parvarchaeum acidophilus ARMAN-5]|jgi:hypothetical protein|uniref:Archaeal Type IV pilin N-terminal domain-containing protein n=1 Tax=Candidatus Parvarchaeum acidophilus ARMAN-5 TaxID=662762 RepID=D6GV14_PARA5|nr:MAG: hypothetical protein BJBARM5_0314 [Candidatus Parvarchaeum acidophilus ARMAN-5]
MIKIDMNKKGQESLELIIGFSIAMIIIGSIFYIIFTFYPGFISPTTKPSYSGFTGFIVHQGYIASDSLYYINFQNVLNENIKIEGVSIIINGVNYTSFKCSKTYLPALETTNCNLTAVSLGTSFTGNGYIYYTPTNISFSPVIAAAGSVIN